MEQDNYYGIPPEALDSRMMPQRNIGLSPISETMYPKKGVVPKPEHMFPHSNGIMPSKEKSMPKPMPKPMPEPMPKPMPAPMPKPMPKPMPAPMPKPMPIPVPIPMPIPIPEPIPVPKPVPVPMPYPVPTPVPAPAPAPIELDINLEMDTTIIEMEAQRKKHECMEKPMKECEKEPCEEKKHEYCEKDPCEEKKHFHMPKTMSEYEKEPCEEMKKHSRMPMPNMPNNNSMPAQGGMAPCDAQCQSKLALAMAFVPKQKIGKVYQPMEGLENGTMFPELNLPFLGKGGY